MKRFYYFSGIAFLLLFSTKISLASHAMGGHISYQWISGNSYFVSVTFYRDCAGIAAPNNYFVDYFSDSCGVALGVLNASLPLISTDEGTPVCSSMVGHTMCSGGFYFGYERYFYGDTISLPFSCPDWRFGASECCRNTSITSLSNAASYSIYFETSLNNLNTPFNNSITFSNLPTIIFFVNQTIQIDFGGTDIDGDSTVYHLVQPLSDRNTPIPYAGALSVDSPMQSSIPIILDSISGVFTVNASVAQAAVVALESIEYRFGEEIARTRRDIELIAMNSAIVNPFPILSGINGTNSFSTFVCEGDTLVFTITSSDPNSSQTTSIDIVQSIPAATIIIDSSSNRASVTVTMPGDSLMVSGQPYQLILSVRDDACPTNASQQYIYEIYVTNCDTSDVWPGDANNDLIADVRDILPIGIAYGATGNSRVNATTNWIAQPSVNWNQPFASGLDYKFADCDGNGVIDMDDVSVINLNVGQTHLKQSNLKQGQVGEPAIYFETVADSFTAGEKYDVYLSYGDSITNAENVYGLAFEFYFNTVITDSLEITFENLQMGTEGVDLVTLVDYRLASAGKIAVGMSRTDGQNITLTGEIAKISFRILENIDVNQSSSFMFDMVNIISNDESELPYVSGFLVVPLKESEQIPSTINNQKQDAFIQFFPNPSDGIFEYKTQAIDSPIDLVVKDIHGKIIIEQKITTPFGRFDLSKEAPGMYIVGFNTASSAVYIKLLVM